MSTDLAAKRLELMHQFDVKSSNIAALYNPGEPSTKFEMEQTEAGARAIDVKLMQLAVTQPSELEQLFALTAQANAGGVIVFTHGSRSSIATTSSKQRRGIGCRRCMAGAISSSKAG